MISDQQRREVAARLRNQIGYMRENKKYYLRDLDVVECGNKAYRNIAASVEKYGNQSQGGYIRICETLADLIDRPTCHLELTDTETHGNAKVRIYECSECGGSCEEIYGKYERCPHCGAEVINDA